MARRSRGPAYEIESSARTGAQGKRCKPEITMTNGFSDVAVVVEMNAQWPLGVRLRGRRQFCAGLVRRRKRTPPAGRLCSAMCQKLPYRPPSKQRPCWVARKDSIQVSLTEC